MFASKTALPSPRLSDPDCQRQISNIMITSIWRIFASRTTLPSPQLCDVMSCYPVIYTVVWSGWCRVIRIVKDGSARSWSPLWGCSSGKTARLCDVMSCDQNCQRPWSWSPLEDFHSCVIKKLLCDQNCQRQETLLQWSPPSLKRGKGSNILRCKLHMSCAFLLLRTWGQTKYAISTEGLYTAQNAQNQNYCSVSGRGASELNKCLSSGSDLKKHCQFWGTTTAPVPIWRNNFEGQQQFKDGRLRRCALTIRSPPPLLYCFDPLTISRCASLDLQHCLL